MSLPVKSRDVEAPSAELHESSSNGFPGGRVVNASGHEQELERQFSLSSIISTAITTGNVWVALAGTIVVALYNGGPTGVIYEFVAVSVCYWFVAASIAELASAIPSSGGVYYWATVTAGKWGRFVGYLTGWWNALAWIFVSTVALQIVSALAVTMAQLQDPSYTYERWHVFLVFVGSIWIVTLIALFGNRTIPRLEQFGSFLIIAGFFITIVVAAVMPHEQGRPYASSKTVWATFTNLTGYTSSGMAFVLGMLNGAFAVGVPDLTSHLAEEMVNPSKNIPKAILAQYVVGFVTAILYLIAIFYGLTNIDELFESSLLFTLGEIYLQVSGSPSGAIALLFLVLAPTMFAALGCFLTATRMYWTLARDGGTPFSHTFAKVSPRRKVPSRSILLCAVACTILGCIYLGNVTAFNAFTSSYIVLSMASYTSAILPHLVTRRRKVEPGYFWMPGAMGFIVNAVAVVFMLAFIILFCFPFSMPVEVESMNYTSVIFGGFTILMLLLWIPLGRNYVGPQVLMLGRETEISAQGVLKA